MHAVELVERDVGFASLEAGLVNDNLERARLQLRGERTVAGGRSRSDNATVGLVNDLNLRTAYGFLNALIDTGGHKLTGCYLFEHERLRANMKVEFK